MNNLFSEQALQPYSLVLFLIISYGLNNYWKLVSFKKKKNRVALVFFIFIFCFSANMNNGYKAELLSRIHLSVLEFRLVLAICYLNSCVDN